MTSEFGEGTVVGEVAAAGGTGELLCRDIRQKTATAVISTNKLIVM
jgi:hypothetical protein